MAVWPKREALRSVFSRIESPSLDRVSESFFCCSLRTLKVFREEATDGARFERDVEETPSD